MPASLRIGWVSFGEQSRVISCKCRRSGPIKSNVPTSSLDGPEAAGRFADRSALTAMGTAIGRDPIPSGPGRDRARRMTVVFRGCGDVHSYVHLGMACRYSIAQARAQLPAIVDLAAAGREVELTRRGEPVAVIVSTRELERLRGCKADFPTAYKRFMEKFPSKGAGVDKRFARSLRDRTIGREVVL